MVLGLDGKPAFVQFPAPGSHRVQAAGEHQGLRQHELGLRLNVGRAEDRDSQRSKSLLRFARLASSILLVASCVLKNSTQMLEVMDHL